jgi:hypothetical protein
MPNKFFLQNWDYKLSNSLINKVKERLTHADAPTLGSLNLKDFCDGILLFDKIENGIYFIYLDGKYYVGKASSCTLLERLSKHLDGRKVGSFNNLLKGIGKDIKGVRHYTLNQQHLLNAKLLFLPVSTTKLKEANPKLSEEKKLAKLEKDIIVLMGKNGCDLINKPQYKYSGEFEIVYD